MTLLRNRPVKRWKRVPPGTVGNAASDPVPGPTGAASWNRANTTARPSGDHAGWLSEYLPEVIWRNPVPSGFMVTKWQ